MPIDLGGVDNFDEITHTRITHWKGVDGEAAAF
jgi:hypothetical protein